MHTKNRAFFSLLLLFLFVLYALAPLQGFAIEEPKEQKTIRVAFPYQAGISYTDEKGNPRGYTYDYLEKIAQFTGWKFEYETFEGMTSNEALLLAMEKVQSGELDLLGCMAKNHPPFEEIFTYSAKSYGVIYSTLAVKDSNLEVNESNYMNIDGLRLGLTTKASSRNENAQKFLTEQGVNFEPVYADSFAGLVALLNAGEVDVIPDVTINGIQGTRHIGQFSPTPFYFASGKGNTQLMASLDDAIKQLNMADPYFQYDLTQKYFGDNMDDFFITPQEKAYLKEKDTLKVLYIPDCAPFIVEDNHGKLTGISVLLMDNFAKAAGLTVEYVRYDSSKDFSKEFSQGGYDCIIGLPINASYNAKLGIVTSNPYMTSSTLSFSRPNQVSSVAEAESVALLRGSELAQLFPDKEILYYDTTEECISAVVRGKADVGCGNQYSLEYYAHKSFVNLNMVPLTDQEKNMEISVSRDNASTLLPILNRYILNLNDNDIYAYHTDVTTVTEVSWLKGLILASPLRTIIVSLCLVFIVVSSILLFFFWRLSRRENAALNSANNAKSEFLSRVSHDMRTPMNAIISFSDPQIEKSSTREDLLSDMAKINLSGQYLLGLINDVLDMSKIENAKVVLKVEPTDIDALFHSVSAAVSPIMKEKEIQFSLKVIKPEVPLTLSLDILRVKQIFINLLSNGAKFTPNQGRVNCTVNILPQSDTTAQLQIVVEDNGIGMSEEFQEQMFEPFAQEHQDHSGGSLSGTGLGLAIVKRLVDLMDGTITVSSTLGKGTTFTLALKVASTPVGIEAPPTPEEKKNALAGKRILLCEDHPMNIEITSRLLSKKGILFDVAENGALGLERFSASSPNYYDGILMDILMPVMDGLTATEKIRQLDRPDAKTIPIIAMTANAFDEDVEKSIEAGMNAHLTKPVSPQMLYAALEKL